jgi:hypothetical protein
MEGQVAESEFKPHYTSSRALIVGIDGYYDPGVPKLGAAEADARALAEVIKDPPYEFDVKLLTGREATRAAILEGLSQLRTSLPDDRLLFYFAGHGNTVRDRLDNETGYILAYDSTPEQDFTAIPFAEVVGLRHYALAKHIGFILDACFSGAVLGLTRIPQIASEKFLTRRAFQVIAAGAADQPVSDFMSMTGTMLQVLRQQPFPIPGLPTFSTLGFHLQQSISEDTRRTQIPQFGHLTGSQGGDILLYAQPQASPEPRQTQSSSARRRRRPSRFPTEGITTAEVDLAGRLDDPLVPTVLSVSAGLSHTIWISPEEKLLLGRFLFQIRPKWSETRSRVFAFSILLAALLKPHIHKLDEILIDHEYLGHEHLIKNTVLTVLRSQGRAVVKSKLRFARIPGTSHAARTASLVYKRRAEPDQIVTAQELMALIGRRSGPLGL